MERVNADGLVVTHEASETGAPILLNLCRELSLNASMLVLVLKQGSLEEDFRKNTAGILMPKQGPIFAALLSKGINNITGGRSQHTQ